MLLTFSLPQFEQLILTGVKRHTIRRDAKDRWHAGMRIHFWMGNPRNTKRVPKPYPFATGVVASVQDIRILTYSGIVWLDREVLNDAKRHALAVADGFADWDEMAQFFPDQFAGKLIHWADLQPVHGAAGQQQANQPHHV